MKQYNSCSLFIKDLSFKIHPRVNTCLFSICANEDILAPKVNRTTLALQLMYLKYLFIEQNDKNIISLFFRYFSLKTFDLDLLKF